MYKKKNVLILAGGYGSRLFPITKFIPKIFLQYRGTNLLDYHLKSIKNIRIKNIYINLLNVTSYKKYLNKYNNSKNIKFIFEKRPSGTAGILRKILLLEKLDLLVIYSDTFFENDQGKIIKKITQLSKNQNICISSSYSNNIINDKGVIISNKNYVKKFIEKPNYEIKSKLYFSGLAYIPSNLNRKLLNFLNQNNKSGNVLDFSSEILSSKSFKIKTYKTENEPLDFGNWRSLIKNKFRNLLK